VFTTLIGITAISTANNPEQNVKSHSYSKVILLSSVHRNNLHVPWHVIKAPPAVDTTTTIVASTTTSTTVVTTTTTTEPTTTVNTSIVTPEEEAAWQKVAICEEGGDWSYQGSVYSGGLGMLNSTWVAYGGLQFAPNAGLATIDQQIIIAEKIQPNPPDQNGCSGSW